ncbi:type II toxin-antitoxin system HicB family antitoxin [Rhizobium sp. C4]|nr:type II toxin-antitoxin system HicB family antitoxin [Rhizobium sp. C4]MCD2174158.1 type II toxin-antitoxin system HicB family antitoxin [Rhizobium sp. C4]
MEFCYRAKIEDDPEGGFLVSFEDVPEALTQAETLQDACANAVETLGLALRGILAANRPLPRPAATCGTPIAVAADDAMKLAVISAFRTSGLTKTELARRLGKQEAEARRILDPDHATKIATMQDAMRALGKTIVVSVMEAA